MNKMVTLNHLEVDLFFGEGIFSNFLANGIKLVIYVGGLDSGRDPLMKVDGEW